jgi:hypothetical protein
MTISLSNVTGTAQTGLTSPTYTIVADTPPPGTKGKQYAVSALGGTQTGVEAHAIGKPFTVTYSGPVNPRGAPATNISTGQPVAVPRNTHKLIVRKGVEVVTGYFAPANFTLTMDIPAGSEIKDPESIRAALSCLIGAMDQLSSGLGDTLVSGTI